MNLPRTVKLVYFPYGQNSILLRLENIADKFDVGQFPVTPYVQIDQLAQQVYQKVNHGQSALQVIVQETSHTANQLYTSVVAGKSNWKGVDDLQISPPTQPRDKSSLNVALEAQRIRTFIIQYIPADPTTSDDLQTFLQ